MKPLLPIRHSQGDFFICDLFDSFKDDIASMEHPVFSLSTKPDHRPRKYEHNGNIVEIFPASQGLATIHDKDILLYLASQFMAELNRRQKQGIKDDETTIKIPPQTLLFTAYDYFILTNRATTKLSYERLEAGLQRLSGTRIQTNIRTNGMRQTKNFGILDSFGIIRQDQDNPNSRMIGIEVKLSDWFYNSLIGYEVLTISKDYFRLRKPLERRIYEICRKHCGSQTKFIIGLDIIQEKTGSGAKPKEFRRMINTIIENDHLPDYKIHFDERKKNLIIRPRKTITPTSSNIKPFLKTQTYENAQKILRPHRLDKYEMENIWWDWVKDKPAPKSWDAAFIGFCKIKVANL